MGPPLRTTFWHMQRRDFLLLRTGQPAVLSCERLFMRYVDAQMNGTRARLFESLARDLDGVTAVRLTDTSWLSRDDLRQELDAVLCAFSERGGRIA